MNLRALADLLAEMRVLFVLVSHQPTRPITECLERPLGELCQDLEEASASVHALARQLEEDQGRP